MLAAVIQAPDRRIERTPGQPFGVNGANIIVGPRLGPARLPHRGFDSVHIQQPMIRATRSQAPSSRSPPAHPDRSVGRRCRRVRSRQRSFPRAESFTADLTRRDGDSRLYRHSAASGTSTPRIEAAPLQPRFPTI
jgi:hypothetical protein